MTSSLASWVEINTHASVNNVQSFRKIIGEQVVIMAVVKANAYGHGLVRTAKAVEERVEWFGVNNLTEGLELRNAGIQKPILILGYVSLSSLGEAVANNLSLTVYNRETVEALGRISSPSKTHLKIETGTGRQGIFPEEVGEFLDLIKKFSQIKVEGISSHFADLEEVGEGNYASRQLERFQHACAVASTKLGYTPLRHIACTAAALVFPQSLLDLLRLGIGMYGLWPSESVRVATAKIHPEFKLEPVLTWKTRIAQLKNLPTGYPVGYGGTIVTKRPTRLAILPVGYYDGYDRGLSNCGQVLVRGRRAPVVGRVCMNMTMVDVTGVEGVGLEDEVALLGRQGKEEITAGEIAQKLGTINYEVVSRINPLLPGVYI